MRNSSVDIRPMSATTGALISGVDLREPLDDLTYREIRNALNEHCVIFFRDQDLTPEQQLAFAERFGPIHYSLFSQSTSETYPYILEVRKEADQTRNIGGNWHTDHPFQDKPPLGSILLAKELPPFGGDTLFASMYHAYDTLSDGMRKTLSGMSAVHSKLQAFKGDKKAERQVSPERMAALEVELKDAVAIHPVTPTHPESGRKVLFVNETYTVRFDGWTVEESRPLLDYLFKHASKPENTCRFRWEERSIAFWDNRSAIHYALNDYHGHRRLLHRITVEGGGF
jgi:taurine dioxygenase